MLPCRHGRVRLERSPLSHPLFVRVTHWLTFLSFLALLITGAEIVISHPRFYWGEVGNVNTPAWLELPIPASRAWVNTAYPYVLPDQNGWSRSLHFQKQTYNPLQRLTYLGVIFGLFPLLIWTGLAMSPAFTAGAHAPFPRHSTARPLRPRPRGLAVAANIADRYGLLPPDSGGLYGVGHSLTYASHCLLAGHALARASFPATGSRPRRSPPEATPKPPTFSA